MVMSEEKNTEKWYLQHAPDLRSIILICLVSRCTRPSVRCTWSVMSSMSSVITNIYNDRDIQLYEEAILAKLILKALQESLSHDL